ncbi:MAG TPA: type I methionyl aminopeptidase, partial [Candidatus Limnocylindria bacterium]|nr:type I methionyl aminopeptidase [Candidatus Limnocylindria bacterium]
MITLKTPAQMAKMREAGRVVAAMLDACRASVRPGVTTAELDRVAAEVLRKAGAESSFLGYSTPPYPATICTSVNQEIVHGIPSPKRKLADGDIVGIDAGAILDGWHADAAITVPVGRVSPEAARLIAVTEEALRIGIASAKVGARIGDIGAAIEEYVRAQGLSVVHNYVGHGIGRAMHEDPQVPNYRPTKGQP